MLCTQQTQFHFPHAQRQANASVASEDAVLPDMTAAGAFCRRYRSGRSSVAATDLYRPKIAM
jgi:hypothetical protein